MARKTAETETADNSNTLENSVGSGTVNQEGAPAELVEATEEAKERGYLGDGTDKPDYSQANPDVMRGTV